MTSGRAALAGAVMLVVATSSSARAQSCALVPARSDCAPLTMGPADRRAALETLDQAGRAATASGDYAAAGRAFGCLVQDDPTPESAGNLALVLREQGQLVEALRAARCAEELATDGATRERARARRADIERRLTLAPAAAPPADATLSIAAVAPATPQPAARPRRTWGWAALGLGAAAGVTAGALYLVARDRAQAFDDEQVASGFSPRARNLRDQATALETGSWISAGVGLAAALAGGLLLTF
jgi:hypothetical protein